MIVPNFKPRCILLRTFQRPGKYLDQFGKKVNNQPKTAAKANSITILSNDYVEKTRALLADFGEIPIIDFASMWDFKYDECIDFVQINYDGGLVSFLRNNSHLFELVKNRDGFFTVSLISRPASRYSSDSNDGNENLPPLELCAAIAKQRSIDRTSGQLFNEMSYLWLNKPWRILLERKATFIASSAYEHALDCHYQRTCKIISHVRSILQVHASGMKVNQFYKYIKINEALEVFSVSTSVSSLIDELPEIFYRKKSDDPQEDVIFDGMYHTIDDLSGRSDKYFKHKSEPGDVVTRAINSGLYQMTLLLIKESGQIKGLKINVWMKSIRMNFYNKNQEAFERDLEQENTMIFFLSLARYNLIELRSHDAIKNDIRAFLPRKYVTLSQLKATLADIIDNTNFEMNDIDHQCDSESENVVESLSCGET